ncbi:homeobox protein ATH1-like isoform X1 [Salvia hispanica]|uniref:homeobox protein ATH1-like isoform X1 n=1 Tax=Salvia hispanica TaxID=49212 RepID=UPI002009DB8E|nr:homeobox protein ATH1-like isoform X1 [Salvia hispanica]
MQSNAATGPHGPVADGSSLASGLISLSYTDLVDRHIQNNIMAGIPLPPVFGEEPITLGRGQMVASGHVGDEFWTPGKYIEGISSNPSACVNPMFEAGFGGLPYDASMRWGFNGGVDSPELQESSVMMNEWMLKEHERLSTMDPNKELSLSIATRRVGGGSELSSSGVSSYTSLDRRRVGSDNASCSSSSSLALNGSSFFLALQEILAEFACYALESSQGATFPGCSGGLETELSVSSSTNSNNESKKKHLMSLLQLVDNQYSQCLDEIHTVVSAFRAVTELDPNLHARFALPTVSAMYRDLRGRISSHILAMGAARHDEGETREDRSFEASFVEKQWAIQQIKKRDHQLWRPQRGLPERSVSVLRAWMFQNFLHPYPKDAEKHLLALNSGLTRSQVSNWFINARVRLWKPMIEEMYAEMNKRKSPRNQEDTNGIHRNLLRFESRRFTVD